MTLTLPALAFGLSAVIVWLILRRADALGLIDRPNARSSHARPTPRGGGVGVALALVVTGVAIMLAGGQEWPAGIVPVVAVLAVLGFLDDRAGLRASLRLVVQALCVAALVVPVWAIGAQPPVSLWGVTTVAGWPLAALALVAGLWWINLFNFMDGTDGIAGAQAVFLFLAGSVLALAAGGAAISAPIVVWMVCGAAAAAAFLLFNWPPARIFMGDAGSLGLGGALLAAALATAAAGILSHAVWAILAAGFVSDATVTLVRRLARGHRPAEAHRTHAYQRLARRWGGHRPVLYLSIAINVLWLFPIASAVAFSYLDPFPGLLLAYGPLAAGAFACRAGLPEDA